MALVLVEINRPFWIRWGDDGLEVGHGVSVGGNVFMSTQDFSANPNKASFASGVVPEWGYWKISNLEGMRIR